MNQLKQLDIAHLFCKLLHCGNTGTREELAQKLGVSPKWVTVYKQKIEMIYNVEIHYCRKRQAYFLDKNDYHKLPPLFRLIINLTQNVKGSVSTLNGLIFVSAKPSYGH